MINTNSINDTIVAISTARGNAALAIIRISGPQTFEIVKKLTNAYDDNHKKKYGRMYRAVFYGEDRAKNSPPTPPQRGGWPPPSIRGGRGGVLDAGMLALFKAPKSYTGEDMAEIYCHGNDFIVSQVLETILIHCRLAEKGEFTLRSFLNKKLDLTQAEAVGNLLNAQNKQAQKAALCQLEGKLYAKIKKISDEIVDLRVLFELAIDFVEDEVPDFDIPKIIDKINNILCELKKIIDTANDGIIIINGLKITLVGAPNVGKSSIFNAFLETERAIVTEIPGTTRDYMEESFSLNGYQIKLYDTAGIQETDDKVEKIGIEKTFKLLQDSDMILYVTDSQLSTINYQLSTNTIPCLKILNKIDLLEEETVNKYILEGYVPCSAIAQGGLDELKKIILEQFKDITSEMEDGIITNARQLACVKKAYNCLEKAGVSMENGLGIDFVAFDIQEAGNAIGEIIGLVSCDDMLDKIFEDFCIGK